MKLYRWQSLTLKKTAIKPNSNKRIDRKIDRLIDRQIGKDPEEDQHATLKVFPDLFFLCIKDEDDVVEGLCVDRNYSTINRIPKGNWITPQFSNEGQRIL